MKNESLWTPFVSWLTERQFRADLETAAGKSLKNVGLSYQSDKEYIGKEKKTEPDIFKAFLAA